MASCLDSKPRDCNASQIALAASLQALFVFASRVAASSPTSSRDDLLKSVAAVLPVCLSGAVCRAGETSALLDILRIMDAAEFLDRGWALAVGESCERLTSPSRGVDGEWLCQLRVKPMLVALQRDPGDRLEEGSAVVGKADLVFPIGHPHGFGTAPIPLAEELHRTSGQLIAWNRLVEGASHLPPLDGLADLETWLWHFDSFLQEFLHGIPAYWEGLQDPGQTRRSTHDTLYDQSRLAGAIAVGLARHAGTAGPPLLLVSGEMDSIQNYILGTRASSDVDIADLTMRGRSSFLRLVVEIAAYRVCENLHLPPGSVVMSAASKFIVLAPNTVGCRDAIGALQILFDRWALTELSGQTALSMAVTACSETELETTCLKDGPASLQGVLVKLARRAQESRLQRFALCEGTARHPHAGPAWDPPIYLETNPTTDVADFQAHLARALVADNPRALLHATPPRRRDARAQSMPIMGFEVAITSSKAMEFEGPTPMQWDLRSWSGSAQVSSWRGRCRKPLAVYSAGSVRDAGAHSARLQQVLKGDIDHLSTAFQSRMPSPNLSRFAVLSRELEGFFSHTVPGRLAAQFPNLVTILSGGDDFIYLGSSADIMEFSQWLQAAFADHTKGSLTLSAGASLPFVDGASIADAVEDADDALELAKQKRNCIGFADISWSWPEWSACAARVRSLQSLIEKRMLSRRAAADIGEMLAKPATSAYLMVQIEFLLRAEAERYGQEFGGDQSGARARKADAFQRLKALLLLPPEANGSERVLVPLTLAYTTL
jgi:hypothetical protein